MDLSKYKARLKTNSLSQAFINDTISIVNSEFSRNPSYKKIQIDGIDDECQYKLTNQSNVMNIWLRPTKTVDKGMYISLDNKIYMVIDFIPNEIYPKAEIELCNNTLKWRDTFDNLKEYDCIIKGDSVKIDDSSSTSSERFVKFSDAEISVLVQYNDDTKEIKANDRFLFGDDAFDVIGIDKVSNVYNGKGILKLTIRSTGKTITDDTSTGVADESGNSDWGGW